MSIKNVVIRKKINQTDSEIIYPVTSIENVVGLSSILESLENNHSLSIEDINELGLATKTELTSGLDSKVDIVEGKGLSTNDYTTAEKNKLEAVENIFVGSAEPDPTENKLWFAIE